MLKKLSKQFQLLRELIFIQNIEKSHESKPFVDFSYDAFKQNAILINSRNLRHWVLRCKVLRIDNIRKTLLVERLAKFHRNLALVT